MFCTEKQESSRRLIIDDITQTWSKQKKDIRDAQLKYRAYCSEYQEALCSYDEHDEFWKLIACTDYFFEGGRGFSIAKEEEEPS